MFLLGTLIISFFVLSDGFDRSILSKIPQPVKGYNLQSTYGKWYYQYRLPPCSWFGSREFTDFECVRAPRSKNSASFTLTMRNGMCNSISSIAYIQSPGVLKVTDLIGDVFSGLYIIVAENPKSYSITYGCTKVSVFGDKCDDPSLTVKTRQPFPDKTTIAHINNALKIIFGMTLNDIERVPRNEPCIKQHKPIPHRVKWW